ncbi:hypothetical protein FHS53_004341 [Xanthobacter tagetidis]|nr:hypothetical protein [Xanthobacter tagetidis]
MAGLVPAMTPNRSGRRAKAIPGSTAWMPGTSPGMPAVAAALPLSDRPTGSQASLWVARQRVGVVPVQRWKA